MRSGKDERQSAALIEATSWTLASELTRRHPGLEVRRHHPGGGQYDCLAVRSEAGLQLDLNRTGRIHVHSDHAGRVSDLEPIAWAEVIRTNARESTSRLERTVGLPHVTAVPSPTPRVLTYRILAAFARLHAFGRPVDISMSTIDTSGHGAGPASWLSFYPEVARRAKADPFGFWCASSRITELVLETETGTLHRTDGSTLSLPTVYVEEDGAFERLLARVLLAA